jgi:hypothetical protein
MNPLKLPITFLFLLIFNLGFSQDTRETPTLNNLESFCEVKTSYEFSQIAQSFGFTFERLDITSHGADFIFQRKIRKKELVYTERFIYSDFKNGKNTIQIVSCLVDLWSFYEAEIYQKYNAATCREFSTSNVSLECYSNNSNFIKLYGIKRNFSAGITGNEYCIMVNNNLAKNQ